MIRQVFFIYFRPGVSLPKYVTKQIFHCNNFFFLHFRRTPGRKEHAAYEVADEEIILKEKQVSSPESLAIPNEIFVPLDLNI